MRSAVVLPLILTFLAAGCSDAGNATSQQQSRPVENKQQASVYPEHAVLGRVNGREMLADRAQLKNEALTIRQGDDFFATRQLTIFLFNKGPLSGLEVGSDGINGLRPHAHVSWRDEGENLPETEVLMDGFDLSLRFGKETEFGVPYAIRFKTDRVNDTQVAGKGFATFKEIKVKDGKLDRTFDSFDTLDYIAAEYLQEKNGGVAVEITDRFDGHYSSGHDNGMEQGYLGVEYKQGDDEVALARLQLKKDAAGWQVVKQLADTELDVAHPLVLDPEKKAMARSSSHMSRLTAQAIEDEYNAKGLVPFFRKTDMSCDMVKGYEEGNCEFSFQIKKAGAEDCIIRNFHLKLDGEWKIVEELETGYRYDFTSGKLVEDKYPGRLCRQAEKQS